MAYAELSIDEDERKGPGFGQLFNDAATTVYEFSEGQPHWMPEEIPINYENMARYGTPEPHLHVLFLFTLILFLIWIILLMIGIIAIYYNVGNYPFNITMILILIYGLIISFQYFKMSLFLRIKLLIIYHIIFDFLFVGACVWGIILIVLTPHHFHSYCGNDPKCNDSVAVILLAVIVVIVICIMGVIFGLYYLDRIARAIISCILELEQTSGNDSNNDNNNIPIKNGDKPIQIDDAPFFNALLKYIIMRIYKNFKILRRNMANITGCHLKTLVNWVCCNFVIFGSETTREPGHSEPCWIIFVRISLLLCIVFISLPLSIFLFTLVLIYLIFKKKCYCEFSFCVIFVLFPLSICIVVYPMSILWDLFCPGLYPDSWTDAFHFGDENQWNDNQFMYTLCSAWNWPISNSLAVITGSLQNNQ